MIRVSQRLKLALLQARCEGRKQHQIAQGHLVYAIRSVALATLPSTFRTCLRVASGIQGFNLTDCYLFGGSFPGVKDVCCNNCIGNQFVKGAQQAHRERTGEWIPIRLFYDSHISGNDFTALVRVNSWTDSMGL